MTARRFIATDAKSTHEKFRICHNPQIHEHAQVMGSVIADARLREISGLEGMDDGNMMGLPLAPLQEFEMTVTCGV